MIKALIRIIIVSDMKFVLFDFNLHYWSISTLHNHITSKWQIVQIFIHLCGGCIYRRRSVLHLIRLHVTYIRNGFKLVLRHAFANLFGERLSYAVRVTILAGRLVFPSGGINVRAFGFQVIICRYEDVIVFNRYENTSFCRCRAFYSYNAGVFKF